MDMGVCKCPQGSEVLDPAELELGNCELPNAECWEPDPCLLKVFHRAISLARNFGSRGQSVRREEKSRSLDFGCLGGFARRKWQLLA